ncbi:MAG: efflux RND transporter periplasmic adaptor subunit [Betaproteobacteria bacterium]|nr:efflux RND transporter periplasmic adaptor subunit [Betaproteobacteria bacterium]
MRRRAFAAVVALALLAALGGWWLSRQGGSPRAAAKAGAAAVPVTVATVERRDVPVRLIANGTVVAIQSVDIRAQITSTVREVHIREGQTVARGELLVSLDSRAEEANLKKAEAQVEKDRADLANAQRTLERQRQLFEQKFISQSALDTAQNQVDSLKGQLAVDMAAVESAKVAIGNTQIRASFAGRTGAIGVRPGSLVQPNGTVLVTVTQIDPIQVAFTLPEKELPGLQRALAAGAVSVAATPDGSGQVLTGRVNFVDNAVDTSTGTIRVKAEFDNRANRLWPGMYVNVSVAPRTLEMARVVPVQAVQTGPENRFVFVVGDDSRVTLRPVLVEYLDSGIAAVTGVEPGTKVVLEGAQNLGAGSLVSLPESKSGKAEDKAEGRGKAESQGKAEGQGKAASKAPS